MVGRMKERFKNPAKRYFFKYKGFCNGESADNDVLGSTVGSENCDCGDGSIRTGIGLQVYKTDAGNMVQLLNQKMELKQLITAGEFLKDGTWNETMGVMTSLWTYLVYDNSKKALVQKLMLRGESKVFPVSDINGRPWVLIVGTLGVLLYNSIMGAQSSTIGSCLGGCVCGDRAFVATSPFTIHYSAPLDFLNFEGVLDESGELYLRANRGAFLEMRAVGKDVYILYEYGIMRLKTSGATRDFQLERLEYSGGKIFENSFGVCNGKLFFLATDGVYISNGERFERGYKNLKIQPHKTTQTCSSVAFEGKWLLRFYDAQGKNRMLVLETDGKRGYYATDLRGLSDWDGKILCQELEFISLVDSNGVLPSGGAYCFESQETDFGHTGRKNLRTLRFEGEGSMTLTVKSGDDSRSYNVVFADGTAAVRVRMRGERFQFTIQPTSGTVVRNMTAEIERL